MEKAGSSVSSRSTGRSDHETSTPVVRLIAAGNRGRPERSSSLDRFHRPRGAECGARTGLRNLAVVGYDNTSPGGDSRRTHLHQHPISPGDRAPERGCSPSGSGPGPRLKHFVIAAAPRWRNSTATDTTGARSRHHRAGLPVRPQRFERLRTATQLGAISMISMRLLIGSTIPTAAIAIGATLRPDRAETPVHADLRQFARSSPISGVVRQR